MSLYKPGKDLDRKKIIDQILRDLNPDVREEARRILITLSTSELIDRTRVNRILKKKGLLK